MSNPNTLKRTLLPVQMISVPVLPGTITPDTAEGAFSENSGNINFSTYDDREDVYVISVAAPSAFNNPVITLTMLADQTPTNAVTHLFVEDTSSAQISRVEITADPLWDMAPGQVWEILLGVTVVASYTVLADDLIQNLVTGLVNSWNASGDNAGITAFDQNPFIRFEGQSDGTAFTLILGEPDINAFDTWVLQPWNERLTSVAFKEAIKGTNLDGTGNGLSCDNGPLVVEKTIDATIWNDLFEGSSTVQVRAWSTFGQFNDLCTPNMYTHFLVEFNFGLVEGAFVPGTGLPINRWRSTVPVIKPNGLWSYLWGDDVVDPVTGQWVIKLESDDEVSGGLLTNTYTGMEVSRSLPELGQLPIPWQNRVEGGVWSSMSLLERRPMIMKTDTAGGCERI